MLDMLGSWLDLVPLLAVALGAPASVVSWRDMCRACGRPARVQAIPRAQLLAQLRAAFPAAERALVGWPAIQAQLAAWHVVTREGYAPSVSTLRLWRARRGLPVRALHRGQVWTTSTLLAAWTLGPDADAVLSGRDPEGRYLPRTPARAASALADYRAGRSRRAGALSVAPSLAPMASPSPARASSPGAT